MAERLSHTAEIQEEVIRALLASAPAVMNIATQLDLTPREVRTILQETLMQFGDPQPRVSDAIPITAHAVELPRLKGKELRSLLGKGRS
ncbi:MAG: hypothetical protein LIP28_06055 [Deltaproteobacteria bacterium]|nr:hypothetical protein [Deltaproteobacteria bacterium]